MTDRDDLRELIAAYLDGDLDARATDRLEARMADEPWVAREVDAMADLLVDLGGFDDIELPHDVGVELRAGIEAEIGHQLPQVAPPRDLGGVAERTGAAAATGWAAPPAGARAGGSTRPAGSRPGGARPAGQRDRSRRWRPSRVLQAAAIMALLAAGALTILQSNFTGSDDAGDSAATFADAPAELAESQDGAEEAAEEALQAAAAPAEESADSAVEESAADGDAAGVDSLAADEAAAGALEEAPAEEPAGEEPAGEEAAGEAAEEELTGPSGADVVDLGRVDSDDAAVRAAVADRPAVDALLGQPASAAQTLASEYEAVLREQPAFADGIRPDACVSTVLLAAASPSVPAVVARIDVGDGPTLAYALVSASGDTLDMVQVWVADPDGCRIQRVIS